MNQTNQKSLWICLRRGLVHNLNVSEIIGICFLSETINQKCFVLDRWCTSVVCLINSGCHSNANDKYDFYLL